MTESRAVEAAGGLVWRARNGVVELAVVHRPRYDDWSLPKGKLEPGESPLTAAVREVREEIGADIVVSRRVGTVRYTIGDSLKRVTYWSMRYRGGAFAPNAEVATVEWLPLGHAVRRLTYDADRSVVTDFAAMPEPEAVVVLVRHAKAGKRSQWSGPDDLRPLDPNGIRQAARLRKALSYFGPERIYSAVPLRCQQTVQPLADSLGLIVEVQDAFSDETYLRSPATTQTALLAVAKPGTSSVVCSQGVTIPELVDQMGPGVRVTETKKGAWWVLSMVDGEVIAADHYDAP
ncbi:bifunctional NUDIX hydrolase/histidine phosphatase family protein [Jatrophihabitans sp.]|uniref:NUDIX hydrolase n=1 Tax=Jatrophihabitans sp. TaxID=1932789 RepID=UPI0030C73558|nr:mutT1 [Jatrophihabitans sp.]